MSPPCGRPAARVRAPRGSHSIAPGGRPPGIPPHQWMPHPRQPQYRPVFTADLERGLAFAERARAGWVNVNASTNLWESHLPFGGRSGTVSGRGRVGGRYVMDAFTEPKTVVYPAPSR